MKFTLEISMDNATFDADPTEELNRILRKVGTQVATGATSRTVLDANGNTVGTWAIEAS